MTRPASPLWAYTYRLVPPQPASRLKAIRALLEHEHTDAIAHASTWEGRLVADERISHILVLSDSPELDLAANRRLEAQLRVLRTDFALTVPMPLDDEEPNALPAVPPAIPPQG